MDKQVKIAVIAVCIAATVFLGALTFEVLRLPSQMGAVVAHANDTLDAIQVATKNANNSWNDLYWDVKSSVESSAVASRATADTLIDLHASLTGGTDTHGAKQTGLFNQAQQSVALIGSATASIQADVHGVALSTDATLKPLQTTLTHMSAFTQQLNTDLELDHPKVQQAVDSLNETIGDLHTLISDPNIPKTLTHVEATTGNVAEVTKTLNVVTLKYRKPTPWWKKIGMFSTDLVRLVPVFF